MIEFREEDIRYIAVELPDEVKYFKYSGDFEGEEKEVRKLMGEVGKAFRALPDWNAYILTALPDFERYFGKTADKKKKLFNANLVCGFYSYFGKPPKENDEKRR